MKNELIFMASIIFVLIIFSLAISKFWKKERHNNRIAKSKSTLKKVSQFEHGGALINYLRKIDPFVFEELLLTVFEKNGVKIIRNKKYTGDGGIDGKIIVKGEVFLIQAKRHQSYVKREHIKEFSEICKKNQVSGFFIHTGKTPNQIPPDNVRIIGGKNLVTLIKGKFYF